MLLTARLEMIVATRTHSQLRQLLKEVLNLNINLGQQEELVASTVP